MNFGFREVRQLVTRWGTWGLGSRRVGLPRPSKIRASGFWVSGSLHTYDFGFRGRDCGRLGGPAEGFGIERPKTLSAKGVEFGETLSLGYLKVQGTHKSIT